MKYLNFRAKDEFQEESTKFLVVKTMVFMGGAIFPEIMFSFKTLLCESLALDVSLHEVTLLISLRSPAACRAATQASHRSSATTVSPLLLAECVARIRCSK